MIGGSGSDEWDCLDRFDRRTRGCDQIDIANVFEDFARGLDDYDDTAVLRFDYLASRDFNQNGMLVLHSKDELSGYCTARFDKRQTGDKNNSVSECRLLNTNAIGDRFVLPFAEAFENYDLFRSLKRPVTLAIFDDPVRHHIADALERD